MRYPALFVFAVVLSATKAFSQHFDIVSAKNKVSIFYDAESRLDSIAANLLASDIQLVSGYRPRVSAKISEASGNIIVIGSVNAKMIRQFPGRLNLQLIKGKWESYAFRFVNSPTKKIRNALIISGSDLRGTAYGVFSLSEKIGVSPWYWWADVMPVRKENVSIEIEDFTSRPPAVKYRGIFINDEDWGVQPWAAKTFEPETGDIGPKTYAKVFELLLRLKANLIWPAMHPSTKAFFSYPGNIKAAEDYQIVVSSSHAEPMLRNNVGEWEVSRMGRFNYFTNKDKIYQYWEERIKQSKGINAIYSLGMRGVHDGQMEGVKDLKDAVPVIEKIIKDQRTMLSKYINRNVTAVPQVLTPYKEVLDIYDYGLKVPDDVTLVWPDDNYGYINRLNNEKELARKGGAGVYYHASYWGRPHDYLWLPSTHPSLLREEMMKAYETGARQLWVVNVGDIKPQEYNIQQFLDMAYQPEPFKDSRYTKVHLQNWVTGIFGKEKGNDIAATLWEYYQLAFERKPEFMGWSQTEPETKTGYTAYNHFYYGDEAQHRIDRYNRIETTVRNLRTEKALRNHDAFYQLVYYPVTGASAINKKFLYRDKAFYYGRQSRLNALDYAQLSKDAYDSIVKETAYYNTKLNGGKWKLMMSMNPRNLNVYKEPDIPPITIDSTEDWGIAPEGSDTNTTARALPRFDNLNNQKYFIDVFLRQNKLLEWTAKTSGTWIRLEEYKGVLDAQTGKKQVRIWVSIDWNKLIGADKQVGKISFEGDGKKFDTNIEAIILNNPELSGYKGFIENNGFLSFPASQFTRQKKFASSQWKLTSDFGYTGSVLQAYPLSIHGGGAFNADAVKRNNAAVEFDFYTFTSAAAGVYVFAISAHPINNNFGVSCALSIDDSPLMQVNFKTEGRSEEWKRNVLQNRAERKVNLPLLKAGKHTLKIYAIDPGVMLDEIRIDLGGLRKAYGSLSPTIIKER